MKVIFIYLFLFCSLEYSIAQTINPQVISSAGNNFTNGSNHLEWTLGEPVTSTLNNGNSLLTQGFHQNNLVISAIDNVDVDIEVTIFPNPTIDILQMKFGNLPDENIIIELFTAEAKLLLTKTSNRNTLSQIDMSKYHNGMYLLKIGSKTVKWKSYRIVKSK